MPPFCKDALLELLKLLLLDVPLLHCSSLHFLQLSLLCECCLLYMHLLSVSVSSLFLLGAGLPQRAGVRLIAAEQLHVHALFACFFTGHGKLVPYFTHAAVIEADAHPAARQMTRHRALAASRSFGQSNGLRDPAASCVLPEKSQGMNV